jgi:hypothetical protein
MKTLVYLTLACAAGLQAATYTSGWSAFDSGNGQSHQSGVAHGGQFSGWFTQPLHSADYTAQAGQPSEPAAEPMPGAPLLTVTRMGNHVRLSWPLSAGTFVLEEKAALDNSSWVIVPGPYQTDRTEQFILLPAASSSGFYRLMARQ